MIVTIHQPEHMPWMGFFNKVSQADLLVILDTVQFRKNYFQNRNKILSANGPMWLTVPVIMKGYMEKVIKDIEVNNAYNWREKHYKSIYFNYKNHPCFNDYAQRLQHIYGQTWEKIVALNEYVIRFFLEVLGISTPMIQASELNVSGSSSDLLLDICMKVKADVYLAGQSAVDYLDGSIFTDNGISVVLHDFNHPQYQQKGCGGSFVSHMSTLDLIMNMGSKSIDIIREGDVPLKLM
ncbi:MAG: WbqC family protein [Nitrospirae bacterium]|nr:WbqC family protein [Nitrospirota bacterium]